MNALPVALILVALILALGSFGASAMIEPSAVLPNNNRAAFLAALRMSEGTASYSDPYSVLYGGGTFYNHTDHPALTGEWTGAQTQWGHTSAAGAYQFEVGTWTGLGGISKYGDFNHAAQDRAAIDLISQCGALGDIDRGDIETAINKLGTQWASLPSSVAGQPTVELASFVTSYQANGGSLA